MKCVLYKIAMFCIRRHALLIFFHLLCLLCLNEANAQTEMQFSGCADVPKITCPGSAGHTGNIEAMAAYRKQWVGFDGSPSTTVLAIDGEVKFLRNFHGVGAMVIHDKIGAFTTTYLDANYSYHLELSKGFLGLGLRLGAINAAFNTSDLSTTVDGMDDDYHQESDELLQSGEDGGTVFDVGFGAFYETKLSYVSFSLLHLTAPTIETKSYAKLKNKPLLTLGAARKIGEKGNVEFDPKFFFKTDFTSWQLEFGADAVFRKKICIGLGYRLQDAVFLQFAVDMSNGVTFGYSYDISIGNFGGHSGGSHEIMIGYKFNLDIEKRTKRYKSVRIL
ncbi:MAG: PorP/SprF family type IX secretion system membrane protein [Bacteroidales bacterium]|nr:PorP/SprF family type IX secretion system membrane protein [Bacteroidales bacterium]